MYRTLLKQERPLADVPLSVVAFLLLALCLQLGWHAYQGERGAEAEDLPPPLSARAYTVMSLGESITLSKVLNLWLQAFDNQPGLSISFHQLDYPRISQWLDTILELDPKGPYPMLVAARVYGSVSDPVKQRFMMDYIYRRFLDDPNRHWRWLAHAVITAKYEIRDMKLALKYARALAERATGPEVPYWARDMQIIVLEDMGQLEAAKVLVGALIDSGEISDIQELSFLSEKIRILEEKSSEMRQDVEISTEKLR